MLWEALREELRDPEPERVAALSQRLTDVISVVAMLAEDRPGLAASRPDLAEDGTPAAAASPPRSPGVVIDEGASPIEPVVPPAANIEIRDERAEEAGPLAWIDSIGSRLERHRQDGISFAVLLIEVRDIDRLAHAETAAELARLLAVLERALERELRSTDVLTREAQGRYWLVSDDTDGGGAHALAERFARTVRRSVSHRGVGLEVAIGIAVCPEDGRDAASLAAHADIGVYAARAAGRAVAPADDPAA